MTKIKIVTWNILAPCYRVLQTAAPGQSPGSTPQTFSRHISRLEKGHKHIYEARSRHIIDTLLRMDVDVMCLQEFWFHADHLKLWQQCGIHHSYEMQIAKREGNKDDGCVIFYKRNMFKLIWEEKWIPSYWSTRIAQALRLAHAESGQEILLINTHLSFPHNYYSKIVQDREIKGILDYLRLRLSASCPTPNVFLLGDFNANPRSSIYAHLLENGFVSAFYAKHQREPVISHHTHAGQHVSCDFIFGLEGNGCPTWRSDAAFLHPEHISDAEWLPEFDDISDHRPLCAHLALQP